MKKLFGFIALILISLTLVGCSLTQTTTHTISEVIDAVEILYAEGDNANSVTQNFSLPQFSNLEESAEFSWESDNSSVVNIFGIVNRQQIDTSVQLTLNVKIGTISDQKIFNIIVVGLDGNYSVSFYDNDILISIVILDDQELIAPIDDPVKIEYTFLGWATSPISDTYFTFNQPISENIILYAQWEYSNIYTYEGYYEGADGLTETTLVSFLRTLVNQGFTRISYGEVRYKLDETDKDPNNSNNILTIYDRRSISNVWDAGATWNREHVWPNSRLGVPSVSNSTIGIGSDLHNLRASLTSTNSSRSNKVYDAVTNSDTYFPGDDDKGDVARIIFYMYVAYADMRLTDNILPVSSEYNYLPEGREMGRLSLLLQWNIDDPVDSFEQNRNEVIYSIQHNRNPFIDHPEFATKIWGTIPTRQNESAFLGIHKTTSLWIDSFMPSENVINANYIC